MPLTELTTITGPGIHTQSNIVSHNINSTGIVTATVSAHVGTGITLSHVGDATFSGIVTASKFIGDGSDLTSLPAGLGTALHPAVNTPLNSIFYVNDTLHVTQNSVVTLPNTSSNAYTQYANVQVEDSIELTIEDDVNFIPDVLSLFP